MMPADFPIDSFEAVHMEVAPHAERHALVYPHFAGAWHAIAYRFLSLVECGDAFTESLLAHGTSPEAVARYQQERSLFGFFSNSFSTFEAFFYGMFAVGSMLAALSFPMASPRDQRRVSPKSTLDAYRVAFPSDPIIGVFTSIVEDPAYKELQEVRNILTHRTAPGRTFFVTVGGLEAPPDEWKIGNIPLDKRMAPSRREHVARLSR
jgi:hypothetical protein